MATDAAACGPLTREGTPVPRPLDRLVYAAMGRLADAREHYECSARDLVALGLAKEAAILRAHLATLDGPQPAERPEPPPARADSEAAEPDDTAAAFAADRLQNARVFHHFGMHLQARQQLEELLASLPEHLAARQLLVEVCRALGDEGAAARHLRLAMYVLRRQGEADAPAAEGPEDPLAALMEEIREDVERVVDRLGGKGGGR